MRMSVRMRATLTLLPALRPPHRRRRQTIAAREAAEQEEEEAEKALAARLQERQVRARKGLGRRLGVAQRSRGVCLLLACLRIQPPRAALH